MDSQEQDLLEGELEEYVEGWSIPHREEHAPEDLTDQEMKEEMQSFRAGLEGYTFGILRGLRLSSDEPDRSQNLIDGDDRDQLRDLIERQMMAYMKSLD